MLISERNILELLGFLLLCWHWYVSSSTLTELSSGLQSIKISIKTKQSQVGQQSIQHHV